jgi:hypothetical protein
MYVYFESQNPVNDHLREMALRRARVATRHLSHAVSQAKVQLTKLLGFASPEDKYCRVELTVGDTGTVVATARAVDWRGALDKALRRAVQALPQMGRRGRGNLRQILKDGAYEEALRESSRAPNSTALPAHPDRGAKERRRATQRRPPAHGQ